MTTMQHTTDDGEDDYGKRGPVSTTASLLVVVNWSSNDTPEKIPRRVWLRRRVGEAFLRKSVSHTIATIAKVTEKGKGGRFRK